MHLIILVNVMRQAHVFVSTILTVIVDTKPCAYLMHGIVDKGNEMHTPRA